MHYKSVKLSIFVDSRKFFNADDVYGNIFFQVSFSLFTLQSVTLHRCFTLSAHFLCTWDIWPKQNTSMWLISLYRHFTFGYSTYKFASNNTLKQTNHEEKKHNFFPIHESLISEYGHSETAWTTETTLSDQVSCFTTQSIHLKPNTPSTTHKYHKITYRLLCSHTDRM